MTTRLREQKTLAALLKRHRVVGIIGARQVGKTTLARSILKGAPKATNSFDLENPEDLARLADPMLALKDFKGLVQMLNRLLAPLGLQLTVGPLNKSAA